MAFPFTCSGLAYSGVINRIIGIVAGDSRVGAVSRSVAIPKFAQLDRSIRRNQDVAGLQIAMYHLHRADRGETQVD